MEAWRRLWPRFSLDRADHASLQLLPLLAANLRQADLGDDVAERLARIRNDTGSRNHALFAAGRRLLLALSDAGIETLLLKGGAMAVAFYRDAGLRPMVDLDVLVPTGRAQAAMEILGRTGWSSNAIVTPEFIRMGHAAEFAREGNTLRCDLHWHVYWECCQPDADEDLWGSSVPLDFEGAPTRMLGPADQLLHVCVHGSRRARRPVLLWIPDALHLLRGGGIDWARLIVQAERRRVVLRVRTMLYYLHATFAAPVPDDVLARLLALPVSHLERREYQIGNRPQGLLGELPSYWCNYRRLHGGARLPPLLGFARYLQQTWRVASLKEVAVGAVIRARHRARALIFGAPTLE